MPTYYRDLQRPVVLETGVVDSSGAEALNRLSTIFKSWSDTTANIGGDLTAQAGAKRGAEEGAAGTPQPQTGWRALTRFGQAYNGAAEVTYSNKLQTDIHDTLSRIEMETEADPQTYAARAGAYRDTLMRDVPEAYKPRIGQLLDARLSAGALRIEQQAVQRTEQEAVVSFTEGAPARIQTLMDLLPTLSQEDGDQALAEVVAETDRQLEAMPFLDPVQRMKMRAAFMESLDAAILNQHVDTASKAIAEAEKTSVVAADKLLAQTLERTDLTDEEKQAIRVRARQSRELLQYERGHLYVEDTAKLYQSLAHDAYGPAIERRARDLYEKAAIGDTEYRSILARSAENYERALAKKAAAEAATTVIDTGHPLYPGNPEHVKAVTQAFDDAMARAGIQPGDKRWADYAVEMVKRTNILPKSAEQWAAVSLMSNNPLQAAQAAEFINTVRETNKVADAWNQNPKVQALAINVANNMKAMPQDPQYAYDLAMKTVNMDPTEKALREDDWREETKKQDVSKALPDALRVVVPGPFNDIKVDEIPIALRAENSRLVHDLYVNGTPFEDAQKAAADILKKTWGFSTVNGKQELVKFPPGQATGVPDEIIRADLEKSVQGFVPDPKAVRLVPTWETYATNGRVYGVEFTNAFGQPEVALGPDNKPMRYGTPDPGSEQFDRAMQDINAENLRRLEEARARRDRPSWRPRAAVVR